MPRKSIYGQAPFGGMDSVLSLVEMDYFICQVLKYNMPLFGIVYCLGFHSPVIGGLQILKELILPRSKAWYQGIFEISQVEPNGRGSVNHSPFPQWPQKAFGEGSETPVSKYPFLSSSGWRYKKVAPCSSFSRWHYELVGLNLVIMSTFLYLSYSRKL